MRGRRFLRFLKVAAIVAVAVAVFGFVVSHLWNYLMPGLFGLHSITFWQAVGLTILGRLLFGGFGSRFGGARWREHMAVRWDKMTPEEREKFREGMRGRCGGRHPSAPTPAASPTPGGNQ